MADYDDPTHVIAKIKVKIGAGAWHEFGPGAAADVKTEASAWIRAQQVTKPDAKIDVTVAQESPQVPWEDGGTFKWSGEVAHGQEYAAQWTERFPAWGGSR